MQCSLRANTWSAEAYGAASWMLSEVTFPDDPNKLIRSHKQLPQLTKLVKKVFKRGYNPREPCIQMPTRFWY